MVTPSAGFGFYVLPVICSQVWARTQALDGEPDGVNGFLLSMLAAHLTDRGTLVNTYLPVLPVRRAKKYAVALLLQGVSPHFMIWQSIDVWGVVGVQTAAMSVLQLVRAVLAALAKPSTFAKGLVMSRQPDSGSAAAKAQPPPAAAFRQHHSVVFTDPSGFINLAAHVQPSALAQVGCHAGRRAHGALLV